MFNENLTIDGHIIGMLYRDLRTMKTCQREKLSEKQCCQSCRNTTTTTATTTSTTVSSSKKHKKMLQMVQKTNSKTSSSSKKTNNLLVCNVCSLNFNQLVKSIFKSTRIFSRICYRLGEVFVLGACLLSILRIPTVLTAPLQHSAMELNGKPKWVNPCDIDQNLKVDVGNNTQQNQIQLILGETQKALDHAKQFRNEYVKHTFNVDFEEHHQSWESSFNYNTWLPNINKSLGENPPQSHLENIKLDETLQVIYNYLQVFAVALEQLVYDMQMEKERFHGHFAKAFENVNAILCEYQLIMIERGVQQRPDVTREIMTDEIRKISSATGRNLRDWVIFRDYMNTLEYAVAVLDYLNKMEGN